MALETIDSFSRNEKQADEKKAVLPLAQRLQEKSDNKSSLITIDKAEAERFMLAIEECVGDIEEQKELVDKLIESKGTELEHFQSDTIKKFNALIDATNGLKEKISATESYENYLEEQIKNANLTKEVAMLEQQLQKEKAEISLFIRDISNTVSMKLGEIEIVVKELKSVDSIIEERITQFKNDMESEAGRYEKNAETRLDETGSHIQSVAESQISGLKAECDAMLKSYTDKCREHLEIIKKQSIDFLKQCEAENKKLIEKVPAVANTKYSAKDIIIYALAIASIASLAVQMFV